MRLSDPKEKKKKEKMDGLMRKRQVLKNQICEIEEKDPEACYLIREELKMVNGLIEESYSEMSLFRIREKMGLL